MVFDLVELLVDDGEQEGSCFGECFGDGGGSEFVVVVAGVGEVCGDVSGVGDPGLDQHLVGSGGGVLSGSIGVGPHGDGQVEIGDL